MPGLRQERKDRTRRAILEAAEALFLERGYAGTATLQIARRAGIAEGTVFNYFPAKAGILLELLYGTLQVEPYEFGRADRRRRGWLADEIVAFLGHYLTPASRTRKALLREVFSICFQDSPEGRSLLTALAGMDAAIAAELGGHLIELQRRGTIPAGADVDGFLQLTYGLVMFGLASYTLIDEQSYAELLDWLRMRVGPLVDAVLLADSARQRSRRRGTDPRNAE